jgi:lysozyme
LKMSDNGRKLTKEFEGCKLKAYRDGGGVLTIGYGHTTGVHPDDVITMERADEYLRLDLQYAEGVVSQYVNLPLNQNQFDALVDFVFNLGIGQFMRSTLLAKLNHGDFAGASAEFIRWNKDNGKVEPGLTRRCKARTVLFNS